MAKTTSNGHANDKAVYDESKIKTLSSLEHIRLRTGMYIGRLGSGSDLDDGIYILLKEIVDGKRDPDPDDYDIMRSVYAQWQEKEKGV